MIVKADKPNSDEWHWFIGSLELRPDFEVPNPKEDIGKSIGNIRDLPAFFRSEADTIKIDWFGDQDPADAVDGAAVPVFMIQQAVKSMHDIYEAGKEIQKEEMKNLIITCLTAFLFILPGLGEAMAAITGIAMIVSLLHDDLYFHLFLPTYPLVTHLFAINADTQFFFLPQIGSHRHHGRRGGRSRQWCLRYCYEQGQPRCWHILLAPGLCRPEGRAQGHVERCSVAAAEVDLD